MNIQNNLMSKMMNKIKTIVKLIKIIQSYKKIVNQKLYHKIAYHISKNYHNKNSKMKEL